MAFVVLLLALPATSAFQGLAVKWPSKLIPHRVRAEAPKAAVSESSLFQLVEQRDFGAVVQRAREEPRTLLDFVKDAGVAGAISYTVVELSFFTIALPIGYFSWHASTGEWLQPMLLLAEDGIEGKARLLGLLLSYIVLLKSLFPVRLGSTLLLTPYTKRAIDGMVSLPSWRVAGGADAVRRRALKAELMELAAVSRGGIDPFDADEQARFDVIMAELPALNPTADPAQSALFTGEWECRWTTEKELNFVVDKGLLGLPWRRTYQLIDIPAGTLENIIEFEGESYLRVGSTISPDREIGSRFNFAFDACALKWRDWTVPLPPVGKGWGELLYLDQDIRIQKDIRGDIVIATRVAVGDEQSLL